MDSSKFKFSMLCLFFQDYTSNFSVPLITLKPNKYILNYFLVLFIFEPQKLEILC